MDYLARKGIAKHDVGGLSSSAKIKPFRNQSAGWTRTGLKQDSLSSLLVLSIQLQQVHTNFSPLQHLTNGIDIWDWYSSHAMPSSINKCDLRMEKKKAQATTCTFHSIE
jgi:hypothetical protein